VLGIFSVGVEKADGFQNAFVDATQVISLPNNVDVFRLRSDRFAGSILDFNFKCVVHARIYQGMSGYVRCFARLSHSPTCASVPPPYCQDIHDGASDECPLRCFGGLLGLAYGFRLRFHFGLLFRSPPLAHSFSSGFSLGGAEFAALSLRWFRSAVSGSG
jgi:hypothetical protein